MIVGVDAGNQLLSPVITSNKLKSTWSEKPLIYWSGNTLIWYCENNWDHMQNISSTPTGGKLQAVNIFWGRREGKKYLLLEEQESQRYLNEKEEISHRQKSVRLTTTHLPKHQHYSSAVLLPWLMEDVRCLLQSCKSMNTNLQQHYFSLWWRLFSVWTFSLHPQRLKHFYDPYNPLCHPSCHFPLQPR